MDAVEDAGDAASVLGSSPILGVSLSAVPEIPATSSDSGIALVDEPSSWVVGLEGARDGEGSCGVVLAPTNTCPSPSRFLGSGELEFLRTADDARPGNPGRVRRTAV